MSLIISISQINSVLIEVIDPTEERDHKDMKDIYLGLGVQKQFELIEEGRKEIRREKCKQFMHKGMHWHR